MERVNAWMLRSPWIFDFVRGVVSLLFELALWFFFDQPLTIGVLALGVYLLADGVFDIAAWYQARQASGGRGFYEMRRRLDYINYEVAAAFRDIFRALDAGMRGLRVWLTGAGAHPSDKAS